MPIISSTSKVPRWQDLDLKVRRRFVVRMAVVFILCLLFVLPLQLLMSQYNRPEHAVLLDVEDRPLARTAVEFHIAGALPKTMTTDANGGVALNNTKSARGALEGYTLVRVVGQGDLATSYYAPAGRLVITAKDPQDKPWQMIDVGIEGPERTSDLRWFTAMSTTFIKDGMPMDLDPKKIRVGLNGKKSRVVSYKVLRRSKEELDIQYVLEMTR